MKTAIRILTALAAVAGIVYVIATYGDKIVEWARKLIPSCEPDVEVTFTTVPQEDAPQDEAVVEVPAEEAPVEDIPDDTDEPVAEEADFED